MRRIDGEVVLHFFLYLPESEEGTFWQNFQEGFRRHSFGFFFNPNRVQELSNGRKVCPMTAIGPREGVEGLLAFLAPFLAPWPLAEYSVEHN
ncbi:MAG: hypothetical protein ABDK93_02175 [Atribacterota bacterium]